MKVIRFIAFIPVALAVSFLVYVISYYIFRFMIGYFFYGIDGSIIDDIIRLVANVPAIILGLNAGVKVANYEYADKIISGVFFAIAVASIILGHLYGTNTVITIISAIIVIVISVAYLFVGNKLRTDFQ